jgi:hypothetical protein
VIGCCDGPKKNKLWGATKFVLFTKYLTFYYVEIKDETCG